MYDENILGSHRRSNLLNSKPNGSYKENQARVRGSFFAQMLQNIKCNSYKREKQFQQREQLHQTPNQQNLAIVIEAKNLKYSQNIQQFISFQPHRNPSGSSKTFLVRSQPKKYHQLQNNSAKYLQYQNSLQQITIDLQFLNFASLRQLSQPTQFYSRKQYNEFPHQNSGIFIPLCVLKKSFPVYSKLFYSFLQNGIQVFVVVSRKQQKQKIIGSVLSEYCHVLHCHKKQKADEYCFMNIEDLTNLPTSLLILQSIDFPYTKIFPYVGKKHSTQKYSFAKVRQLQKIKDITFLSNHKINIKVENCKRFEKNMRVTQKFDLLSVVKLELEFLERRKYRRKNKNKQQLKKQQIEDKNLQNLQQKLLQYVKIVKNQNKQLIGKQMGKKECPKSSFQVISQLTRLNTGIHKQIQEYVQQSKQIHKLKEPECDSIIYHMLD